MHTINTQCVILLNVLYIANEKSCTDKADKNRL